MDDAVVLVARADVDSAAAMAHTAEMSTRHERQRSADRARISLELEGMDMSPQALCIQQEWIEGRISDEEMLAQTLALHARG